MKTNLFLMSLFISNLLQAQVAPDYPHASVTMTDFAQKPSGFWLFEPADPIPSTANVIVFLHGYGGYNPMIYGAWIRHLVRQGNTVIFPRYQRNMIFPRPPRFVKNTTKGIHQAMKVLQSDDHVSPLHPEGPLYYIGHSYGGVISSNIAINYGEWNLPRPEGVFLVAPGSGPFKGGVLDDYSALNDTLKMLVVTHENDWVVGDLLGDRIFNESSTEMDKYLFDHQPFSSGKDTIWAHHNEAYAVDLEFDTGTRNYTSKRALQIGATDAFDRQFLWPLFDRLLEACNKNELVLPQLIEQDDKTYFPFVLKEDTAIQLIEVQK